MKTSRTQFVLVAVFTVALLAGGAAGFLAARFAPRGARPVATGDLPLAEQLQLSPDQRDQIRQIWEGMRQVADDSYRQARQLDRQREDALIGLLTKDQKERYDQIYRDYVDRYTAVTAKRRAAFDRAVEQTRALLTEPQRRQYEAILSRRLGHEAPDFEPLPAPTSQPPGAAG